MHVAIGILFNSHRQVLIAQRPEGKYQSGLWEFPGGKVEKNETVFQALQRELQEEIGVQVITAEPFLQVEHDYGDRLVLLDAWQVTDFTGEPTGRENQPVRWIMLDELKNFPFPTGNQKIIEKLRLFK
jgi:8-oxo-dGTP diphosphatase